MKSLELSVTKPLRLGPAPGEGAEALVVLLHGVGAFAASLRPLAEALSAALPLAVIAAPDAPQPFDGGAGFQWFSIRGVNEENRASRVASALPAAKRLIEAEARRAGLPWERVAVIGFSQGAILALHMTVGARPPAVVAALAGRIAGPLQVADGSRPPVLLSHGLEDRVIPPSELERAARALRGAGCPVEAQRVPGAGHEIVGVQVQRVIAHLRQALTLTTKAY